MKINKIRVSNREFRKGLFGQGEEKKIKPTLKIEKREPKKVRYLLSEGGSIRA